jgi:hypothetical protein
MFGRKKDEAKAPSLRQTIVEAVQAAEMASANASEIMQRMNVVVTQSGMGQGARIVINGQEIDFGGAGMVAAPAPPVLPTACPNCGAAITPEEVDEADPTCKYCRTALPLQRPAAPPPLNVPGGGVQFAIGGSQGGLLPGGLPPMLVERTHINADYGAILAQGTWCRADIVSANHLPGTNAKGEPVTLLTLRASVDGGRMWATACGMHVPDEAQYLARAGVNVPAKFIPGQEHVLAVDWGAAMQEQPAG